MTLPSAVSRRVTVAAALLAVGWLTGPLRADGGAARPPNILLILADDLGWKDVAYQGSDFYETPNLDRLGREGVVLSSGYACAGNCAPSRACLISGQYTPRHGVYAVGSSQRGPGNLMRLRPVPNSTSLAAGNVTVAEALKAAGYATAMFGKWHLGSGKETGPQGQGFDVGLLPATQGGSDDPKHVYTITRAACEFIEANRDRPFFAYLAHHAVHSALEARPATLKHFQEKLKTRPPRQHDNPLYAACTFDLDDSVGMLLKKLDELGLADKTLVVFTSDNGATPQSSQEPLRGAKGCYYEGGIRVPFVVRWPGRLPAGRFLAAPVANVDLYPTFLAAAGAAPPPGKTLDGENLLPLLEGKGALQRPALFWHFPGYLDTPVPRGRDPVFLPVRSTASCGAW
jgi:arylsulfatase A-like enzyme